jgi:hypothetical protein
MEWNPRAEGLIELVNMFNESRCNINEKHREIFEVSIMLIPIRKLICIRKIKNLQIILYIS